MDEAQEEDRITQDIKKKELFERKKIYIRQKQQEDLKRLSGNFIIFKPFLYFLN